MVMDGTDAITLTIVVGTDLDLVSVKGDIDIYTQQHLVAVFSQEGRLSQARTAIDLNDVDFLDSMGLAALVKARRLLEARGAELWVVCGENYSRRVLRMARLEAVLNLVATLDDVTVVPQTAS